MSVPDCDVMEASPVTFYSPKSVPTRKTAPPAPRFGGVGDVISNVVGTIDSNRLIELMASDGVGMVLPRSAMAFKMRGIDDGRETFLREAFGLIGNVLIAGWFGQGMVAMLGNSVNPYNPHGIPGKAWISAQNMDAFQHLYTRALQSAPNHQEARKTFVNSVLAGLESGDRDFSIQSRLASLNKLAGEGKAQHGALLQMLETTYGKTDAQAHLKNYQQMLKAGKLADLRDALKQRWGKLSKESQGEMALYYNPKELGSTSIKGTNPLDQYAEQRIRQQEQQLAEEALRAGKDPKAYQEKAFIKQRFNISLSELNHHEEDFVKAADHEALLRGLTGTVNLHDADGKTLSAGQSRRTLLREMKHFLEQYVDRATYAADKEVGHLKDWNRQQRLILNKLFAENKSGWRRFIPTMQDGLVTASRKAKGAYTWVPIGLSIAAAGAFTFYNQYLTAKKHGGKIFFPGEGGPPAEGAKPVNAAVPFGAAAATGNKFPTSSIYRNFGSFPGFPQVRNQNGGVIA